MHLRDWCGEALRGRLGGGTHQGGRGSRGEGACERASRVRRLAGSEDTGGSVSSRCGDGVGPIGRDGEDCVSVLRHRAARPDCRQTPVRDGNILIH